jgi:hypothetical protein
LVHCNPSPGNILFTDDDRALLIDMIFADSVNSEREEFQGSEKFASRNACLLLPREYLDDFESLLFVFADLAHIHLPWETSSDLVEIAALKSEWLFSNECLEFAQSNEFLIGILQGIRMNTILDSILCLSWKTPYYIHFPALEDMQRHREIRNGNVAAALWLFYLRYSVDRILKITIDPNSFKLDTKHQFYETQDDPEVKEFFAKIKQDLASELIN